MNKIKLIIADLDGTLLDDEGRLDPEIIQISNQLREKGILFSLASGRNRVIMTDFVEAMKIEVPYMSDNGANVWKKDECLKTYYLNRDYNNIILKILNEEKLPFNGYSTKAAYYNLESERLNKVRNRLGDKLHHEVFTSDKDFSDELFYKITLDSIGNDHMDEVVKRITELCKDAYMKKAEGTFYAITAKGVDKGRACLELADILSLKPEEIMVFGDNNNDVSMFKVAGESVCVANAKEDIVKQAKHVCGTNNEHGPVLFLKEYFNL